MATIANGTKSYKNSSRLSYISVNTFDTYFFNYYTTTDNFVVSGHLVSVTDASPSNCPSGTVLRENGRKLYPGGAYPGITTYMVGVYDPVSTLSGFIDPNAPMFAPYNSDKPNFWEDGVDPTGLLRDLGPPVSTNGSIFTNTTVEAAGSDSGPGDSVIIADNGSIVALNGQIRAAAHIQATLVGSAPTQSCTIDMSGGQIFLIDPSATTTTLTVNIPATNYVGATVRLILTKAVGNPTTCTVTFTCGSGTIHTQGTLSIVGHQQYVVSFMMIHNNHLFETSRTVALTTPW